MATTTNVTTTYAGESAGKYIAAALLSAPTIANGNVTVKPNIKYKEVVKTLGTDGIVKDESCDFTATSTVTIAERILQPKELQVNLQFCKSTFESDWNAIEMGYSSFDVLPKSFSDYIIAYAAEKVAASNEVSLWQGATGTSGQFDGFATLIAADANLPTAQELALVSGGLTTANIQAELGKVVDALPSALYGKAGVAIYVPQNVYKLYVRALGGYLASGVGANGVENKGNLWYQGQEIFFDGIPVVMAPGMASSTMIASYKENLWFGTSLLSDHQEVRLIDLSQYDGSQNVRLVMRFAAGAQYGFAGDIVTYNITNSAN